MSRVAPENLPLLSWDLALQCSGTRWGTWEDRTRTQKGLPQLSSQKSFQPGLLQAWAKKANSGLAVGVDSIWVLSCRGLP